MTPTSDAAPAVVAHPEAEENNNEHREFCAPHTVRVNARDTIKGQIRAALLNGEHLTPLDAWSRFGTSRLAALVHQLRREGLRIKTDDVVVDCAHGHKARVAEYSIPAGAR